MSNYLCRHTLLMQFCCCCRIWMKRSFMLFTQPHRTDSRCTHSSQKHWKSHSRGRRLLKFNSNMFHRMLSGPNVTTITTPNPNLRIPMSSCYRLPASCLACNSDSLPFFVIFVEHSVISLAFFLLAACLPALEEQKNLCFAKSKLISVIK